ncbi:hypothetical protein [Holospora obtusa]|nr:hypothetical protein [Holospora obtusa]
MGEMIQCIKFRLGFLLWSTGVCLQAGILVWGYTTFSEIKILEFQLTKAQRTLVRASTWTVQNPLYSQKLLEFSKEIQQHARHFSNIQVIYKTPSDFKPFIEITIKFRIQHDDIFWNFFKTLYTQHKGRIESLYLSLSREKDEFFDQEQDSLSSLRKYEENVNTYINGTYTARYYYFNPEG